MKKISQIGAFLKKIYRNYSSDLLDALQERGFLDLRPSFLEILMYLSEHDSPSIKEVGKACGLKKQTMTSHLNELERRGYVVRKSGVEDRREQKIVLTENGERFKVVLFEVLADLEGKYVQVIGDVELERILYSLQNFYNKTSR